MAAEKSKDLLITRAFDAPLALVYAAWTEQEHLAKWQGAPEGFSVTVDESDIRTGGRFRIGMSSPQGEMSWLQGAYREVVPRERLVFTHAWVDASGKSSPETLVTITFTERDGKTRLDVHQTGFQSDSARAGHGDGWNSQLDRFSRYLDSRR
ncbi:MAG: Activator of Hsp90 ATPase-like protein [Gemmatimonadetes bacterium]|nr:Activator of Hsp90 ATPase-like protein [Gemmatimonadota bacterium]